MITPPEPPPRRPSVRLLLLLSVIVVAWQIDLQVRTSPYPHYAINAAVGLYPELLQELWAYKYYGVFPVCTTRLPPRSREQADELLAQHGDSLVMDLNTPASMVRHGDFGRLWLLLGSLWLGGDPLHGSVIRTNEALFIVALLAVLWAFWKQGLFLPGLIIVLLAGSNPFQQQQLLQENIFSLPATFALMALALNLPLLSGLAGSSKRRWAIPLASGVFLATAREIRAEAALTLLALPLIYLTIPRTPWRARWAMVALLAVSYLATGGLWTASWNHKVDQARQWVAARGGHPYNGLRTPHHALWHNVWTGLGDFDTRFGYAWDDRRAFAYATPILRRQYGIDLTYTQGYYTDQTYPPDHFYKINLEDIPQYTRVIRDKLLHDITRHPLWYGGILLRRTWRIFHDAVPVALAAGPLELDDPYLIYLAPVALGFLIWRRRWLGVKLSLFSLPLSFTPLLIYSKQGMTYYSIFHVIMTAVMVQWACEAWQTRQARRRRQSLPSGTTDYNSLHAR